jgi:hypothetical protein
MISDQHQVMNDHAPTPITPILSLRPGADCAEACLAAMIDAAPAAAPFAMNDLREVCMEISRRWVIDSAVVRKVYENEGCVSGIFF